MQEQKARLGGLFVALALLLAALPPPAAAQDYEREKRWAEEIQKTLMVGDAAWLEQKNGHRFLALHTGTTASSPCVPVTPGSPPSSCAAGSGPRACAV